jgi:hypothetical protein
VSFLERLDCELRARGVRTGVRERLLSEYADHLACDPAADLGDACELAATFAAELAADDGRHDALLTFAALVAAAAAVLVGQLTLGAAGGTSGFDGGRSLAAGIACVLALLIAPQVALVAGTLGVVGAWRRRGARTLPDAELALIVRRAQVARAAGLVTCAALLLDVANFSGELATWWSLVQAGSAAGAGVALLLQARWARSARSTRPQLGGPAVDVVDEIAPLAWLRQRPAVFCALVAVLATIATGAAEKSVIEGVERGLLEALLVLGCFVGLGRAVGLRGAGALVTDSERTYP